MTSLPPSQHCDHDNVVPPLRPVPDWTGRCPDCGEGVKHDGRGGFRTVRENNVLAMRQRAAELHDFQDGLSRKLTEHGVPAGLSWPDAIDWLARHGGRAAAKTGKGQRHG